MPRLRTSEGKIVWERDYSTIYSRPFTLIFRILFLSFATNIESHCNTLAAVCTQSFLLVLIVTVFAHKCSCTSPVTENPVYIASFPGLPQLQFLTQILNACSMQKYGVRLRFCILQVKKIWSRRRKAWE